MLPAGELRSKVEGNLEAVKRRLQRVAPQASLPVVTAILAGVQGEGQVSAVSPESPRFQSLFADSSECKTHPFWSAEFRMFNV